MTRFDFLKWIQLNILLPLSPFLLKVFIILMGETDKTVPLKILDTPELLFFSIMTCVIAFNINANGAKKIVEYYVRSLLYVIVVLDFVLLGMIYSGNEGSNSIVFSISVAIIPMVIAPIYQLYHLKRQERSESEDE